jgi:hypothetical protein
LNIRSCNVNNVNEKILIWRLNPQASFKRSAYPSTAGYKNLENLNLLSAKIEAGEQRADLDELEKKFATL